MDATYDPAQLRTFLAVAQTLSFTQAARRLGIRQSTVSQHVRRLEGAAGRQLFARDTHRVDLTEDGEAMLGFARSILSAHERAAAFFAGTRLRGRLRFGASEDFVLTRLPEILESFRCDHPEVELQLTVELSGTLHRQLAAGRLDLVLAKRRTGDTHGELMWRDALDWIGAPHLRVDPERPVPLVVFPPCGHHPGPRPGGAGGTRAGLADRLYEYEPERSGRGGTGGPGGDGALPGDDPAGAGAGSGQGGAAGARRRRLRPAARDPPGRGPGGGRRVGLGDPGGRRPAAPRDRRRGRTVAHVRRVLTEP